MYHLCSSVALNDSFVFLLQDLGSAPRVDIDLQSENDEDDDSSSDDSDSDENLVERNGATTNSSLKETEPSIQIQFAMGDLEENPIMELLADGSDKDSKSSDEDSSLVEVEVSPAVAKERVVTKLLLESSQTLQQPAKTGTKPLITELE